MRTMKSVYAGLVACAFAFAWTMPNAQAITCTGQGNNTTCTGAVEGELYPGNTPGVSLNGSPFLIKYDDINEDTGSYVIEPVGSPYADNFVLVVDPGAQTGSFTWVKTDPGELDPTLIAFKLGNNWFFQTLNLALGGTFNFDTSAIRNAISHISIYDSLSEIPLPPALILFGSALVGMTLLGRRRQRASQSSEMAA